MSYQRKRLLKLGTAVVSVAFLIGPSVASAQRGAGGVTGEARLHPGTWSKQRASRHIRHARDYSRDIYRYSRDAKTIDPAVAKSESEELGRNITKAQQEVAVACQKAGSDTATVASLKSIEKHLASAAKQHKVLHEECCKASVDGGVSMSCCSTIILDLDKAQAEQQALLRSLEINEKKSE